MKIRIDLSRTAIIVMIISLALVYPLLWMKMLADPVQYTGADFIAFYAAGRIADNEGAAQAYNLNLQKKYQEGVVNREIELQETFPYIHPPFVIPLAQLATTTSYLISFQRWALLMSVAFVASIPFLTALTKEHLPRNQNLILAIGILLFFPIFQSILLGQDNAIMFLGLSLLIWGVFQRRDWAAGLGLALCTIRPHFAIFLLLPFIFQRHTVLKWFVLSAFALALFSLFYTGFSGMKGFINILAVSGSGEGFRTNEENMINLIGLLRRLFPFLSSALIRTIGWIFYGLALLSMSIYFWRNSANLLENEISLTAVAAILFSPHSHVQDLILLIAPLMVLMLTLLKKDFTPAKNIVLIPLSISLLLLFSYYSPLLTHTIPYVLMFGLLFAIWKYQVNPANP